MSKSVYVWRIATNYTSARVYTGLVTGELVGTSSIVLDKGLTRRRRYDEIVKWLAKGFAVTVPSYCPAKREKALVSGNDHAASER